MRALLLLGVLLLCATPGDAATWYVENAADGGSNSNNCTTALTACATIEGALAKTGCCGAGDIIEVADGNYVSADVRNDINEGGSAGLPLIIRGGGGSCPTATDGTTRTGYTVATDPLHPTNTRPNPGAIIARVRLNASYIWLDCFKIRQADSYNHPVYLQGADRIGLYITSIYVDSDDDAFGCSNGVFGDTLSDGDYPSGVLVSSSYFKGCNITITAAWDHSLVTLNEISTPAGNTLDYLRAGGTGTTMSRNYMYGADITAQDCPTCHVDCVQQFVLSTAPNNVLKNFTFDRNVCLNFHQGFLTEDQSLGSRQATGRIDTIVITNNLFALGVHPGSDEYEAGAWCVGIGSATNVYIYHNTCFNVLNGYGIDWGGSVTIKNNISIATNAPISIGSNGPVPATATYSDNLHWSPASGTGLCDNDGGTTTCDKTYSAISFPDDILNTDPMFTDLEELDFSLLEDSPAINAGATGLGVVVDFLGALRDSLPDIGAHEFVGESGEIPPPAEATPRYRSRFRFRSASSDAPPFGLAALFVVRERGREIVGVGEPDRAGQPSPITHLLHDREDGQEAQRDPRRDQRPGSPPPRESERDRGRHDHGDEQQAGDEIHATTTRALQHSHAVYHRIRKVCLEAA